MPARVQSAPVANVLDRLEKVKRLPSGGWTARCPAHQDRNPSLSINEGNDGRVLLNCHAGCTVDAVTRALGIAESDLFEPREQNGRREVVASYRYEDEQGQHLYDVVRFEPKTFRQRRPDGQWGIANTRRVIYRLPQVRAAIGRGETIYITEGEKDVHALERLGATATCNPMGAGSWKDDYTRQLEGAIKVVIVADKDEAGLEHAAKVEAALTPTVTSVMVVEPASGKDAHDHAAAGRTLAELVPRIQPAAGTTPQWTRINLGNPEYAVPPDPPAIQGLLYAGKRHVISGPPESTKTLVAYRLLLEALRAGNPVAIIDFEMGPTAARRLVEDVGATLEEITSIYYTEPDAPPTEADLQTLHEHGAQYVLIDAAAGAYDATGLDDNARKDVEAFARQWIRPLWQQGIATLLIDHVTKDTTTRGKFTIGSERKIGQADVHLSLEALKPLSRGGTGFVKVHVHKDRPGFLTRPTAVVIDLQSDPLTHQVTWQIKPAVEGNNTSDWRPTVLMERISHYLEEQAEPVSRTNIETSVKGKSVKVIRQALDFLIHDGYAAEEAGSRNARNVRSTRQYRQQNTTPSHPVPPRPDGVRTTPSAVAPPTGARTGSDGHEQAHPVWDRDGEEDPEIQRLLDLYGDTA